MRSESCTYCGWEMEPGERRCQHCGRLQPTQGRQESLPGERAARRTGTRPPGLARDLPPINPPAPRSSGALPLKILIGVLVVALVGVVGAVAVLLAKGGPA